MQFRSASFQYAIVKLLFRASCPSSLPAPREGAAAAGAAGPGGPSGGTRRLRPTPIGPRRVPAEPPRRPLGRLTGLTDEASSGGREGAFSPLCSWGTAALGGHRGSPVPGVPPLPSSAAGISVRHPRLPPERGWMPRPGTRPVSQNTGTETPSCPIPARREPPLPVPILPVPALAIPACSCPALSFPAFALHNSALPILALPCPVLLVPALSLLCLSLSCLLLPCLSLPVPAPSATISSPACKGPIQFPASALVPGGLGTAVGGFGGRVGAVWDG